MIRGMCSMAGVLLGAWLFTAPQAPDRHGAASTLQAHRCDAASGSCNLRWYYLWIDFREWMMK